MIKLIAQISIVLTVVFNCGILWDHVVWAENAEDYLKRKDNPEIFLENQSLVFYNVRLTTQKGGDLPSPVSQFSATYKGKSIVADGGVGGDLIEQCEIEENFPSEGMATLMVKGWNGGASCCEERHVFVKNGEHIIYTYIFDERGSGKIQKNSGNMTIYDQRFIDYHVGKDNEVMINFSPAAAPFLPRILIFEDNAWRADKVGEFPSEYQNFENEFVNETPDTNDRFSIQTTNVYNAIERTFFCLMKGESDEQCQTVLKNNLNEDTKLFYRDLWAMVVKRVMVFKPKIDTVVY